MNSSLAVDLGRTWLRASLTDSEGKTLRRKRMRAVPWKELPSVLKPLLRSWKAGKLESLTAGSTGIWKTAERRALAGSLRGLAKKIRVMSDLELAHAAAFGNGPGILVVASTGSVAYGRDEKGRTARAGGLGPLLGDEGSGFWVGRRALKDPRLSKRWPEGFALRLAHSDSPVRETAALSRAVFRWAQRDPAARAIKNEAARHLAGLAAELAAKLRFAGPIPIACHGSLFRDEAFRRQFLEILKRKNPLFKPKP